MAAQDEPNAWIYSNKQREWVFYSIVCARVERHVPILDPTLTSDVLARASTILDSISGDISLMRIPAKSTIRAIWHDFQDPTRTIDILQRKRQRMDEKLLIERIKEVLSRFPQASTHEIASLLPENTPGSSQSNVWRLMKRKMTLYFYRKRKVQYLSIEDFVAREAFARTIINGLRRQMPRIDRIIFGDEIMISAERLFNSQNDGTWYVKGQQDHQAQLETRRTFPKSVHLWVGLNFVAGILGPFFIDDIPTHGLSPQERGKSEKSLTGAKYRRMIEWQVLEALYQKVPRETVKTHFWWQQDGAGPHCSNEPLNFLKSIFGNRIFSRKTVNKWPARSPDLNPLDYSFWALLRREIYRLEISQFSEIKPAVREACSKISLQTVQNIIADFPLRLRACFESGGRHFEPWLRQYKKRFAELGVCAQCASLADERLCGQCTENLVRCHQRDRDLDARQADRDAEGYDDDDEDIVEQLDEDEWED